jgi:hypothetical protein
MTYSEQWLKKQKYFEKLLSTDAMYCVFLRSLDVSELFSMYAWLQIMPFDLTQLGLGLLYDIPPFELVPFSLDFKFEIPSLPEVLQGIWANFEPVRYEELYKWSINVDDYVNVSFQTPYIEPITSTRIEAGVYDETYYGYSSFDPYPSREMVRTTWLRMRLLRTADISWEKVAEETAEQLKVTNATDDHVVGRVMMMLSAQRESFVLGLSLLGRSKLTETEDGWGVVPIVDAEGNTTKLRFTTLDHLQIGFVLGMVPLGYGYLLPRESVYQQPDGKGDPAFLEASAKKVRGITQRVTASTWAYTNYTTPYESGDYHKSERTTQYHALMSMREFVERWVEERIPRDEANPLRIRQYKNAVLQAISWRAKRHRWGYEGWKSMSEDEFKEWWKLHWKGQGLNESTLENLYQGMSVWLKRFRDEKVSLGERAKQIRRRMSLLT